MLQPFLDVQPQIDETAYVHPAAVVIGHVVLGAESSVWPCATLRADDGPILVGTQTSIQDGAVVHMTEGISTTTIGSRVTVGHGAIIHGATIGDDCIVGMGSIILDNAVIEPGCIIGAGSLVPPGRVVESGSVVVGNPMKILRCATPEDEAWIAHSWQAYVKRTRQFRGQ